MSIVNGEFIVDMTSINNQDMEGDSKARLEGHLKSDDFFSVESYPTAAISINSSELISDGKWNVSADLSIKGFTHPVNFEMISSEDGWSANLVFDRSKYDVRFRSGSFFENLGDKLIYDDIELSINLTTL
jgi:polyisoprenoid-binding protein YceI